MLVKIEAWILIFPGTDFHFPSTSVPPGTFLGSGLCSEESDFRRHSSHHSVSPLKRSVFAESMKRDDYDSK